MTNVATSLNELRVIEEDIYQQRKQQQMHRRRRDLHQQRRETWEFEQDYQDQNRANLSHLFRARRRERGLP